MTMARVLLFIALTGCNFSQIVDTSAGQTPGPECTVTGDCASGRTCVAGRCLTEEQRIADAPVLTSVSGEDAANQILAGVLTLSGSKLAAVTSVELIAASGLVLGAFALESVEDTRLVIRLGPALAAAIANDTSTTQTLRATSVAGAGTLAVRIVKGPRGNTGAVGIDSAIAAKANALLAAPTCPAGQVARGLQPSGAPDCVSTGAVGASAGMGITLINEGGAVTAALNGSLPEGFTLTHDSTIPSAQLVVESPVPTVRLESSNAPAGAHWEMLGDVTSDETAATLKWRYVDTTGTATDALTFTGDARVVAKSAVLPSVQSASGTGVVPGDAIAVRRSVGGPAFELRQDGTGPAIRVRGQSELTSVNTTAKNFANNAATSGAVTPIYNTANAMRLPIYRVQTAEPAGAIATAQCAAATDIVISGGCALTGGGHLISGYPNSASTFECVNEVNGVTAWAMCLKGY
jgi:hypothetical protein